MGVPLKAKINIFYWIFIFHSTGLFIQKNFKTLSLAFEADSIASQNCTFIQILIHCEKFEAWVRMINIL